MQKSKLYNPIKTQTDDIVIENEAEEAEEALSILEASLVDILEADSDTVLTLIELYNATLIALITRRKDFQKDSENSLYANLEKVTHKDFFLDGKRHAPSIRNWLKDFQKTIGTGAFDNVVLTDFLTKSKNAKILDKEERKIVQKMLILYRNIKFYPAIFNGIPEDDWHIIPIEREGEEMGKVGHISGPPRTDEEKEIDELKDREKDFKEGGLERLVLEEEIDDRKLIEELKIMKNKYADGSLERRAIDEEIKKLEN